MFSGKFYVFLFIFLDLKMFHTFSLTISDRIQFCKTQIFFGTSKTTWNYKINVHIEKPHWCGDRVLFSVVAIIHFNINSHPQQNAINSVWREKETRKKQTT